MRDLNEVLDLRLTLPIGGKTYVVDPPAANVGAHLINLLALGVAADAGIQIGDAERGQLVVDDEDMPDFATQCLGPVYDQMVQDGLNQQQVQFCVTTAFYAWTVGKEFAETFWETGGKLGRPAEQSQGQPRTATQTREAEATTTPSPASAIGTRTPLGLPAQD